MRVHRMFSWKCPYCGYKLDAATNITGTESPADGDITVCFACTRVLIFSGDIPRMPTDTEKTDAMDNPTVMEIIEMIRASRGAR